MKKLFVHLLLCVAGVLVFSSCSKEKSEQLNNPLISTLWSYDDEVTVFDKHEFTRYIEFIDGKTVKIWDTEHGTTYTGSYTINGTKVTFNNLTDTYWGRYYISGTFTSSSLTISFSYDKDYATGPYQETYVKNH